MGLADIGQKIKNLIQGEADLERKNEAFNQIQAATGVPIDEKQRAAIIKANVDPSLLLAGFAIKQIKNSADSARGGMSITNLAQPGGLEMIQSQLPAGGSVSQGGVTATIPPTLEVEKQKASLEVQTAADKARVTGEAEIATKQKETGKKLAVLGKKLNTLRKQYDEALPDSGVNSETSQRIMGTLDVIGAKTGVKPNAKLMALQKNKRLQAIQIIKMAGEAGNLAEQEQKGAIEAITSETLTSNERKEAIKQFMELALSGADEESVKYLLKDKSFKSVLDDIGFDYEIAGIAPPDGSGNSDVLNRLGLDPTKYEIVS